MMYASVLAPLHSLLPLLLLLVSWMVVFSHAIDNDTYWEQREYILAQEEISILGQGQILSPEEEIVNDLLMTYKMTEMDAAFEDLNFLPAKNFLLARDEIEASEVFRIIQMMPKGSALHIHDSSAVSTEWLISELSYWDDLYMCYTQDNKFLMKFMANPDTTCAWLLVKDVRDSYPTPEEFDKHLLTKLSLVTDNPQEKYPNINVVWSYFDANLDAMDGLIRYRPSWEAYLYQLFLEYANDNVLYAEMRAGFNHLYELDGTELTDEETIAVYKEVISRFLSDHGQQFYGNRVIYSKRKEWDVDIIWDRVDYVKTLRTNHPDYVVGFDLVGQEDKVAPFKHMIDPLLTLSTGEVKVPVVYHAGETNWFGMSSDDNLIDALLLNTTRIGHGYAITKHPAAKEMAWERDVPLEVCPISNQVLMLVSDLRNHPAAGLVAEGFPIVISSDDPGPFGAKGLSYDFYEAFMALGGAKADLRFLKQLAINSIRYSTLDEIEKSDLMQMWQEKWDQFILRVSKRRRFIHDE